MITRSKNGELLGDLYIEGNGDPTLAVNVGVYRRDTSILLKILEIFEKKRCQVKYEVIFGLMI